jgi:beta-glucosidase
MRLEEKAAQLGPAAPAIPRLGVPEYNWWNEGLHGVARAGVATVFRR